MSENNKISLRRHHDDNYIDEIKIEKILGSVMLTHIYLQERYKTSGLSGNEWRFNAVLEIFDRINQNVFHTTFHSIDAAREYSPFFFLTKGKYLFDMGPVYLKCFRKGQLLWQKEFENFQLAAIGMNWNITIGSETDPEYKHLPDSIERSFCQQPGCQKSPSVFYRYKKRQINNHRDDCVIDFEYDFSAQHIWFCDKHSTRGDCGLEDADDNYLIESGVKSSINEKDRTYSLFGGIIEWDVE